MIDNESNREIVKAYHEESKHFSNRYAPGPPYMDWATQPNPFRFYEGANRINMDFAANNLDAVHGDLYKKNTAQKLDFTAISALFELSLGLSAWKSSGGEGWALRCNPSSGNLHPTEGYLIIPEISRDNDSTATKQLAGVYHYLSRDHLIEERFRPENTQLQEWNSIFPDNSFLVGISSIHWREAWKYGLRALRYCELDTGHAAMAFRYGAAALGWQVKVLATPGDEDISQLLGLNQCKSEIPEPEHPDLLLLVTAGTTHTKIDWTTAIDSILAITDRGQWQGEANPLSPSHMNQWQGITQTAEACKKPRTIDPAAKIDFFINHANDWSDIKAATVIRQRRSAQMFDGKTAMSKSNFLRILGACLPQDGCPPWDLSPFQPAIHIILMVHRVSGLTPGLYALPRRKGVLQQLKNECSKKLLWSQDEDLPEEFPLYLLREGNFQKESKMISCGQDIASDGIFTLGMIGEFAAGLKIGSWGYRRAFWEAGMLGQTLYLEAEAAKVRGTGIGCFLDDTFHNLLGLKSDEFQSLYHFTVGQPISDQRLQTKPPYDHLKNRGKKGVVIHSTAKRAGG
jgi:SagB-type dehydrogenase family enzyme